MKNTILSLAALLIIGLLAAFTRKSPETAQTPEAAGDKFQAFLKQFKPAELPYTITKDDLRKQMEDGLKEENAFQPISGSRLKDPDNFLPNSKMEYVSRVPIYNLPVARLATAQHTAVIYFTVRGYSSAFNEYTAAVFTKSGALVASHNIASTDVKHLVAATIDKKLHAVLQRYLVNWEKNLKENGIKDNSITGLSPESGKEINLTTKSKSEEWKFKTQPVKKAPPVAKTVGAR